MTWWVREGRKQGMMRGVVHGADLHNGIFCFVSAGSPVRTKEAALLHSGTKLRVHIDGESDLQSRKRN